MKCMGYKLNGYDATYRKTTFDVIDRGLNPERRVLEITDINSGQTFIVDLTDFKIPEKPERIDFKTRKRYT